MFGGGDGGGIVGGAATGAKLGSAIAPGIGTAVGAIGGALVGAAGSWFSGKQSADYAERSQKHRYQWMVKDLKKAGLNPMLAVGASPGTPAQPNFQNVGEGALKGFSAQQQAKLIAEQIQSQRAITNKTLAEGTRLGMENQVFAASPLYQDAIKSYDFESGVQGGSALAAERYGAETRKLTGEADRVISEIKKIDAETLQKASETEQLKMMGPLLQAYQDYQNQAAALRLTKEKADEAFFATLGSADKWGPGAKFIIQLLMQLMREK